MAANRFSRTGPREAFQAIGQDLQSAALAFNQIQDRRNQKADEGMFTQALQQFAQDTTSTQEQMIAKWLPVIGAMKSPTGREQATKFAFGLAQGRQSAADKAAADQKKDLTAMQLEAARAAKAESEQKLTESKLEPSRKKVEEFRQNPRVLSPVEQVAMAQSFKDINEPFLPEMGTKDWVASELTKQSLQEKMHSLNTRAIPDELISQGAMNSFFKQYNDTFGTNLETPTVAIDSKTNKPTAITASTPFSYYDITTKQTAFKSWGKIQSDLSAIDKRMMEEGLIDESFDNKGHFVVMKDASGKPLVDADMVKGYEYLYRLKRSLMDAVPTTGGAGFLKPNAPSSSNSYFDENAVPVEDPLKELIGQ